MKTSIRFCLFTLCLFGYLFAGEKSQEIETFVVGTASGYAPYVSLNEKGEYEGFDIDLAHLLAKKINKKLVIQDLGSMPSLLLAVKKKKIDSVIWAVSITEERQKELEMVYYQGEKVTELPVIFWKEIPQGIKKIEDLSHDPKHFICVEAGSYQDSVLQKYPNLKLRHLDKITDSIMELKFGKSFASAIDNSLLSHVQKQYPELKVLLLPLPSNQHALGNGICLNKTDTVLIEKIKKAVEELRVEGKIAELEKKWKLSR